MKRFKSFFIMFFCISILSYGQFKLSPLPFKYNALEPYIDSTTMYIHYNFHHTAYVNNLNKALEKHPELYKKDILELIQKLNELPADIQTAVRNNGGGFYNHTFFWTILAPAGTADMSIKLEQILITNFGSLDKFKAEF